MVMERSCIHSFMPLREGQRLSSAGEAPELLLLITLGLAPGNGTRSSAASLA